MKTLLKLLALVVLGAACLTHAATTNPPPAAIPPSTQPALNPEAEAAARAALEKAYADADNAAKVPTRPPPARVTNAPAATAKPTAAAAATNAPASGPTITVGPGKPAPGTNTPAPAPATTQTAGPAPAAAPTAVNPQPVSPAAAKPTTNTPATAAGAARATNITGTATNRARTQATPVTPLGPTPGAAGQKNVAGAPAPGTPGAPGVPGAGAAPGQAPADAGAKKPDENEVFPPGLIKFQEADLSQVLEIYQELTGRTVLKPASVPAVKITIRTQTELTRAEAVQALDTILSMNGVTMVPEGEKFVKAVAEAQAPQAAGRLNDLPVELLPDAGTYVTHVVQLKNASPNDILPVLTPFSKAPNSILTIPSTSMLVLRDYAENVKRMVEMIEKVDVVPQQEFESVVIPIKYALAGDIAQVLGSLTAGGGGGATTVGRQQTRTGLTGPGGGLGGAGGLPGQPGYNPNNPNQFGQQQQGLGGGLSGGAAGRSSFQNRLQQIVNRAATGAGGDIFVLGQTKIIADERINALLIFASKADLVTISNIIDKLDVVLAQVLIEAIVVEVSLTKGLDYGISYIQTTPSTVGTIFTGAGSVLNVPFLGLNSIANMATNATGAGGFTYAAKFMNFDATASALEKDGRFRVLSRPRIQTSHAVEANLFVGQTRPYVTGSYSYFGGGPQTQYQQQQIGITLSVLPLINAEGLVVLDIRTKVQDIGEEVKIDANFSVPATIDREANSKVAVRDGETIMLGGFISNSKRATRDGVPILKDIPILGALFRVNRDDQDRRELLILLRPTVLPTPEKAAVFASEERNRLPVTRSAEQEFREEERQRNEAEDRRMQKQNEKLHKSQGTSK